MNKQLIAPIASAVALLGFFAPWMSCGVMTFSGMDLATGSGGGMGGMGDLGGATSGGNSGDATPLLFAIPLAALLIIGMYFFFKNNSRLTSAVVPTIIIALIAIVVMVLKYIDVQDMNSGIDKGMNESLGSLSADSTSQSSSGDLGAMMEDMISIKWGFWLTGLAFLGTIYGATQYRNNSNTIGGTTEVATPPGEIVPSSPPPDTSITEDKE